MNKMTLSIVVGLASAGVGVVAGYFVAAKILDEKYSRLYEERLNTELLNIRKGRKEAEKREEERSVRIDKEILNEMGMVVSDEKPVEMSVVKYHKIQREAVRPSEEELYQKLSTDPEDAGGEKDDDEENEPQYDEDGNEIDADEIADETWIDTSGFWDDKPPTVISLQEYIELDSFIDRVTMRYYSQDDVLVDDKDMIVDDISHTIGDRALTMFGDEAAELSNGDPDAVYVVNGPMNLAVEVVRLNQAYSDYLGV